MIILTSRGIAAIPFLSAFLGDKVRLARRGFQKEADAVAGWGVKRSGRHARELAHGSKLPALYLEDGFLRSFGTGEAFPPLSLVVDDAGIYYDSSRPSALENLLNSPLDLLDGMSGEASAAKRMVLQRALSKYNHAPPFDTALLRPGDRPRVLVVDQTLGDLSISLGAARAESFAEMLAAARAENPGATIYVKAHPEVSSGRKNGHFGTIGDDEHTVVLRSPVNPLSLIAHMDRVYAVTSTMGFEALLAGKPVTCFGMPWYAGWGVTDDRAVCPRRTARRSVDELFAAGYLHYPRYLDPATHQRGTILNVIDWLIRQRETDQRLHGVSGKGRMICIGYRRWKQANLAPMLSLTPGTTLFVPDVRAAAALKPGPEDVLVWWGCEAAAGVVELADESGSGIMRMEDGFVRSVGLGSDLIRPHALVLDRQGIYFDPRQPSDLEAILNQAAFSNEDLMRARAVRAFIVEHGITKYNLNLRTKTGWRSDGRTVTLVPGQVEDDASIRFGCTDIRTNLTLLKAARAACPDAFIVYKPHPDVMSGNRAGKLALAQALNWADHIETNVSVISCIEACDEVHTMTSLTGFDALLRGKRVVTYGQPFYAGWGLTEDRGLSSTTIARRTQRLTLDQMIAGVLLRYPIYWDWTLKGYTSCEAVLHRIVEERDALETQGRLDGLRLGYWRRQWRKTCILANAWLRRHP
jgi:capsular polysaccharide export protein